MLQNEMRTLREQFETSFWESVDLEENITQIEQELDVRLLAPRAA